MCKTDRPTIAAKASPRLVRRSWVRACAKMPAPPDAAPP
ncbi:hypothetical protein ATSB10_05000 [Dyella thiooxydans]|uniref:Uncharacterized protein n=1 Tax=Dyella thiooxydans TaxID=445710 RepID=A0A160MY35_9GAMM|nr:hypothetical protein ATSB10_05000 [Dyella thiooxydans]